MRIGILGGSFNPVHNGHLRVAIEALEQVRLDRVDLVPAAQPPHKDQAEVMPFALRRRLLEAAVASRPALRVNPIEQRRSGPSYTVDTLEEYRRDEPQAELSFLLGCNDFLSLPQWHDWGRLFELTGFVVVGRRGSDRDSLEGFLQEHWPADRLEPLGASAWSVPPTCRITYLAIPRLDISGTLVRRRLRQARSVDFLVPEAVAGLLPQALESLPRSA